MNRQNVVQFLALVILLFLGSCGAGSNDLRGSISDYLPLDFDDITVEKSDAALTITYLESSSVPDSTVLKITLPITNTTLITDFEYDLSRCCTIERNVYVASEGEFYEAEDRDYPEMLATESSTLIFTTLGSAQGDSVAGQFSITFDEDRANEIPAGTILSGKFNQSLTIR